MQTMKKRLRPNEVASHPLMRKNDGIGHQIGRQHPGALVVAGAKAAGHVRQSHIGDAGVEHLHERGHRDHNRDEPGIEFRPPQFFHGGTRPGGAHRTFTSGSTDKPGFKRSFSIEV